MKIAILDDDDRVRLSLTRTLECLGHEANAHSTAASLFSSLDSYEPDLIILDQMLGGKRTGIQLVDDIRIRFLDVPIVIVTGYPGAQLTKAVENFDVSILAKPFTLDSLKQQINKCCNV